MTRFAGILFTIHFTVGVLFLHKGSFLHLLQITDIYQQYELVNGKTDFLTFVNENFLEFENNPAGAESNELFENEEQQTPFKPISIHAKPAFLLPVNEFKVNALTITCQNSPFYLIKKYITELTQIFQPPKFFN